MPIEFTRKGRYEVWLNGQKISEHNQEREATETIINHSAVHGDGEYEIKGYLVMARAYGVVSNQDGGDTTPPTTPGSVSSVATSATTGTTSWTASTDNVGVAGYQVFVDGSPVGTTVGLSFNHTGLSPSTQYSVTVTAYDAAGNNSVAGGPSLFTTDANSAPVWSLGNQSYTTGDAVSIDLDANCTDADGDTITYSLVSGTLPSGLALSGVRNQTLSGSVDTVETANFTLGASDGIAAVQNVALTFTISAPDTTAPAAPTGLAISAVSSTGLTLNWDDNAESDLNHYTLWRSTDGVNFGIRADNLTVSNYTETNLNASTTYYYYVTATDDSSNESSASSTVSDTTLALNTPYDLSAYTIPFTYSWPIAPTITSEATVTPATLAANNVNGRRLTLQAGSYGDVSPANDQEWILQSGAEIDTFNFNGSNRVKLRGETPRVGRVGVLIGATEGSGAGTTDILIDGIYQTNGSWTGAGETSNSLGGRRIALINSSLNTASYTIYTAATSQDDNNNLIIAGNYIRNDNSIPISTTVSAQHAVRLMTISTFIFVDNYVEKYDDGIIWRVHCNSTSPASDSYNGYVGGNVLVARGGQIFNVLHVKPASSNYTPGNIYDIVFHDNEMHQNTGSGFAFDMDVWNSHITNITLTNNFSNGSDGLFNVPETFPSFTISGNTSQSYSAGSIPTAASVLGWTP